ncbi:hypothetical protein ADJ70_06570 [Olsenella sp. oral taxon 807]|uniref:hypothetical protein n=1 Tax=Olsenella sp. oral taxon 807 TaxID=712411 RepID=UPI00067A0160|nr:hypothetical protein [Olsenella sp. oral taxon 807]AKT48679.1 hypothetical protein ADJ70_06570 [Olsenella sp. oral taxon 807]
MGRGATRAGPLGVAGTALLCIAALVTVLSAPHLIRMLGEYREGPSLRAALDSHAVQNDKSQHGLTYTFLYQDTDGAGRVRYHFVSDNGGNIPLVITCEFHWFDNLDFSHHRHAGWNYVRSNLEEWVRAYEAWRTSPGYDGPRTRVRS